MTTRIEAAAKAMAVADYERHFKRKVEYPDALFGEMLPEEAGEYREQAEAALAAADAVMFNEAAVERAVQVLWCMPDSGRRDVALAVIEALKGAGDE